MSEYYQIEAIGHIENDFTDKFGIPRQSGIVDSVLSKIIFEPDFREKEAFRKIEQFSHLWLIWRFSENEGCRWSPTVRPPKLGGNKRVGVFASRSPFRPNGLGISCVKFERIEFTKEYGPVLYVKGADLMNKTPIIDIKPYVPYSDAVLNASGGFSLNKDEINFEVIDADGYLKTVSAEKAKSIIEILKQDPRPGYQNDENRIYKMKFGGYEIHFSVINEKINIENIIRTDKDRQLISFN